MRDPMMKWTLDDYIFVRLFFVFCIFLKSIFYTTLGESLSGSLANCYFCAHVEKYRYILRNYYIFSHLMKCQIS